MKYNGWMTIIISIVNVIIIFYYLTDLSVSASLHGAESLISNMFVSLGSY